MEPIGLQLLARERGLKLVTDVRPRRHAVFDVGATPDALVVDTSGKAIALAECKAPGLHAIDRWGESDDPQGVPDEVLVQCVVQMSVWHVWTTHIVALIANEARFFVVEYSEALAAAALGACQRFWDAHVVPRVPPPADGSEGADRMLRGLHPRSRTALRAAPPSADAWARAFLTARSERIEAEKRESLAQQMLEGLIGDDEGLEGRGWRATWKSNASGGVAWKSLAESLRPARELVEAHRMNPARVFRCAPTQGGDDR